MKVENWNFQPEILCIERKSGTKSLGFKRSMIINMNELKNQAVNPFLPGYEYIPDGEPHVFGDRVYLFGSHDRFNGKKFCLNDYVCWSASVEDLSDWQYEGVIYEKTNDPMNRHGRYQLFAPDVAQGPDGRFYLYYAFSFLGVMAVAVCDTPAGHYEFYGYVSKTDGTKLWSNAGEPFLFDPGIFVDDDGRIYLYTGFAPDYPMPAAITGGKRHTYKGGYAIELEGDMLTVKGEPKLLFPRKGDARGTGFEGHEFFEASSMRKMGDTYYFVYSSIRGHELCYATGKSPMGIFTYGGTIISNGDLFLQGRTKDEDAVNYIGNNHGSIVKIGNQWYVFYHRHTNRHQYSRQAMAEKIEIAGDGSILQAEMTSCGLNDGPLRGRGRYEARLACYLASGNGAGRYPAYGGDILFAKHPYLTQSGSDREENSTQYIANMRNGSIAGFKYFMIRNLWEIAVRVRGTAKGVILVTTRPGGKVVAVIPVKCGKKFEVFQADINLRDGVYPLYFTFQGTGKLDFYSFLLK